MKLKQSTIAIVLGISMLRLAMAVDTALDTALQSSWRNWKSGEVMTRETYQYGKFIARIKGDDKLGTITSLFTFWKGAGGENWTSAKWSEIDIELVPSSQ
jgi:beta-glucanase (GH16 family)